jgi:hypothetical protein
MRGLVDLGGWGVRRKHFVLLVQGVGLRLPPVPLLRPLAGSCLSCLAVFSACRRRVAALPSLTRRTLSSLAPRRARSLPRHRAPD